MGSSIPDVLPSGIFHALVIPHEHRFSFAQNHGLGDEVGRLIYQLEETINRPVAWFEHGGVQEGSKVQSVYHNHAHVIATEGYRVIDYMEYELTGMNIPHQRLHVSDSGRYLVNCTSSLK